MTGFEALLDSNVVIAILAEAHEHHTASLALMTGPASARFAVAAHSYAEAYSTLTRGGERSLFGFSPGEAWAALASLRAMTGLVGLTAAQTLETIGLYARSGGVGPRLYDSLIGGAAVTHAVPKIVTWNLSHMRSLFPNLYVLTPEAFAAERATHG